MRKVLAPESGWFVVLLPCLQLAARSGAAVRAKALIKEDFTKKQIVRTFAPPDPGEYTQLTERLLSYCGTRHNTKTLQVNFHE